MSSDVMRSIPWYAIVVGHSPYRACPLSSHHLIPFLSSPIPLSPAISCLLALNNPSPPGVGGADGRAICGCGRGVDLIASHHAVPLSRSRSFATAAAPSSVASSSSPSPMSSPPFLSTRLLRHRPRRPSSRYPPRRRRHHACGSCPPRLSPRPCLSMNGEELRAGCAMLGCSAVVALLDCPNTVSPPRAIGSSLHLVPVVISCGLAASHVPTAGACGAVRSLRLLPHLSVSIVFKMLPYQSFKILRLFDMVLICEYQGVVPHPVVRPYSHQSVLTAHRHSSRLVLASRPSCRLSLTPSLTDTQGGERNGTARTVAWRIRVYMTSCSVICLTFLLYISHSCYISGVPVIYRAFLLYAWHSCYMTGVLAI